MSPRVARHVEIRNLDPDTLDELLARFPALKRHAKVTPSARSVTSDLEAGLLDIVIVVVPAAINVATAVLNYLAAKAKHADNQEQSRTPHERPEPVITVPGSILGLVGPPARNARPKSPARRSSRPPAASKTTRPAKKSRPRKPR